MVKDFIKSNENLSLANRKGDIIYGILDQYTGEEMTLSKINTTPTIDNIIHFKSGNEYFKRVFKIVSIRWFGATGDGITDDSNAFNLVNNIFNENITITLESDFTYSIGNSAVLFNSKTNFYFIGNSTIKFSSQSNLRVGSLGFTGIKFLNSSFIGFKGIKFNVNSLNQAAVGFENCVQESLDNCEIYSSSSEVAQVVSIKATKPIYSNNTIRDSKGLQCRGIWIGNLFSNEISNEILVYNNKIYNNTATGIVITSEGGEVYGNYSCDNLGSGIIFTGANGLSTNNINCYGNKCNKNLFFGIQSDVIFNNDFSNITKYISVTNNICNENKSGGIYAANTIGWTIIGNICNNNNHDGINSGSGIQLDGLVQNIIIKGNICNDTRTIGKTQTNGIACYAQSSDNKDIIINSNICNGNLSDGISCHTVSNRILDNLIVSDNNCNENNSRGLFLSEAQSSSMSATIISNRCFNNTTQDIRISIRKAIISNNIFNTSFDIQFLDLPNLETTPNVNSRHLWRANNSAPTLITNFIGGYEGQEIIILGANNNTTINQGLIQLKNYSNAIIPKDGYITLIFQATAWRELSRSF